jgi:hypothetical protein
MIMLAKKIIFLPYYFSRLIAEIFDIFTRSNFNSFDAKNRTKCLLIEAGTIGWTHIDYQELLVSAKEYLGEEFVKKIEINKSKLYLFQVLNNVRLYRPTHYFYDARSGSSKPFIGLIESFFIMLILQFYGVVPICLLTDFPYRPWRRQVAIVSAKRGATFTLMCPRDVGSKFPHSRLFGPVPMAFSVATIDHIDKLFVDNSKKVSDVTFTGSLYEPRTSTLKSIESILLDSGINLEMKGRNIGSKRSDNDSYWGALINSKILITTGSQLTSDLTDESARIRHLIYRYTEATACGALLVAENVPSISRYLTSGFDVILFETPEQAADKIKYYLDNNNELISISTNGRNKIRNIIKAKTFWVIIDTGLQKYPLL